jgi:hypothetical protein
MKKLIILAVLATALTAKTFALTFSDDLTTGLNPTYWSIVQSNYSGVQSSTNIYSVNATGDGVAIAETAASQGGVPYAGASLNLAALGGSISGDFSAQIQFANAVIGSNNDQVEFYVYFADGSLFVVGDEPNGIFVYDPSTTFSGQPAATSGTFVISRTGSTVTGSFNGINIVSTLNSSPVTNILFTLDTWSGDYPSVTFYNFSLTAVGLEATPVVTWPPPSPITYGTALSSNQLNATANVPGSFAYNPTNGTVLNAGTNTLSVIFTPTDTVDYSSVTDSVSLVVFVPQPIINIQKAVYLTSTNLLVGFDYQVQASSDLINWTNQGSVFTATNSNWQSTNYWNVNDWNQLFFQLQVVQ